MYVFRIELYPPRKFFLTKFDEKYISLNIPPRGPRYGPEIPQIWDYLSMKGPNTASPRSSAKRRKLGNWQV